MDNTKYYVGTELKIAINIQCEGYLSWIIL